MPITQSAKKALRQNISRHLRNVSKKDTLKKAIKAYKKLALGKKIDEAAKSLPNLYKVIDKTAKSGVIKKNTASRLKSRLSHLIAKSSKASS